MSDFRPNPDDLLRTVNQIEEKAHRGKLKIFFGYAAGVGKTYAMLDGAHDAKKLGVDVVVGYVEPHTRPDTLALLEGLEQLPPLCVAYKGIVLKEFDLDAALRRKPQLILVDELAHTNAQGCRHIKRYDDIKEILNAGIDVYTTVNVQHLESLNDIVASITHIIVKERVPDKVFDGADQVELVDIEPDHLIMRLNAGKIYKVDQAKEALSNFFSKENLVALREIALRRTADRIKIDVANNRAVSTNDGYYTGEHILICLSGSPSNAKAIRAAARMAKAFHAPFTALFVETQDLIKMDSRDAEPILKNIKLAQQLGASITTLYGDQVPEQIAQYAKVSGVSKIVLGHSNSRQKFFMGRKNLVERLTLLAPNLEIYIIPDSTSSYVKKKRTKVSMQQLNWVDSMKLIGIMSLATLIALVFYRLGFSESTIITIFILGVLMVSNQATGVIYGIASSVIGVLIFNFFFTAPRFTFQAYEAEYPATFAIMFLSAMITSTLTMRVKKQAKASAIYAYHTKVLLETSQQLQRTQSREDIIRKAAEQLMKLLKKPVIIYATENDRLLDPQSFHIEKNDFDETVYLAADEQAVANWVFKNKKNAGRNTDTLPGSKGLYLAARNDREVFAVLGIALEEEEKIEPFKRSLLITMLNEIAFALEKYNLNELHKQTTMQAESERLRANLLRAISHDLRTPLTTISGNANILLYNELEKHKEKRLLEDIYDDSLWLINLVENLLSVTRLEDGKLNIKLQPELMEEIITEALLHINRKSIEHEIKVEVQEELLMVWVDAPLMIQVFINIIDNAIKYTEEGSIIEIRAWSEDHKAIVEIADNGNGIEEEDQKQIFDMFFTTQNDRGDSRRGLGLGLSLCKSIVNAHDGEIYVKNAEKGGTIFGFTLRLEENIPYE